ncbi:MAG TPA: hypothetical protein VFD67_04640 [Gemmatimonadaceae bacterium]|nr:hypothetical protein [Gemmatimonadaceae bacterium]
MLFGRDMQSKRIFLVMQVALLLFFLLQLPARLYPQFHPDVMDGVRGLFLGIAFGTMIVIGWRRRRRST